MPMPVGIAAHGLHKADKKVYNLYENQYMYV